MVHPEFWDFSRIRYIVDLKNIKLPIGIIAVIVVQAFGVIWYMAQLDSTVTSLDATVTDIQDQATTVDVAVLQSDVENLKAQVIEIQETTSVIGALDVDSLWATVAEFEDRLDELEKTDALIDNEMRTIMSDHAGFGDVLKDLNMSGYNDNRAYGNYK